MGLRIVLRATKRFTELILMTKCSECERQIYSGEDCYHFNSEIYCSDCIDEVLNDEFDNLELKEKMDIMSVNRTLSEV